MPPIHVTAENRPDLEAESERFLFEEFVLDVVDRSLKSSRDGQPIQLPPRAFDLLLLLIKNAPQLVTKTAIMNSVWSEAFVEETNLAVAISLLRKQLGDNDQQNRRIIQTVPKLGYRFIVPVSRVADGSVSKTTNEVVEVAERQLEENGNHADDGFVKATPRVTHPSKLSLRDLAKRWSWQMPVAVFLSALLAFAVITIGLRRHNQGFQGPLRSVVVLPFHVGNSDPSWTYLGVGVSSALNNRLKQIGTILLPSSSSVARVSQGESIDPLSAGRELGVDGVISGSIEFSNGQMNVSASLIRVSDGSQLWSTNFAQPKQQILDLADVLEEEVAAHTATSLIKVLGGTEVVLRSSDTTNSAAREWYLRGRYYWNRRTEENLRKGIQSFQKAITADPNYALAYSGLADSYVLLASYSTEPVRMTNSSARSAALSAMHLDPTLAEPYASFGMISFYTDWDPRTAEQHFQRAIALEPSYSTAHHWYGLDLASMGRLDEALYEIRKAEELDPLSPMIATNVGWILYLQRQYEKAEASFRKVLEVEPMFVRAHTRLGITLLAEKKFNESISELRTSIRLSPDPFVEGVLADALAQSGNKAEARRILARLEKESSQHYVPPFGISVGYIGLGENAKALDWLEKAAEDHSTSMIYVKVDPELDLLRSEPRFKAILSKEKF